MTATPSLAHQWISHELARQARNHQTRCQNRSYWEAGCWPPSLATLEAWVNAQLARESPVRLRIVTTNGKCAFETVDTGQTPEDASAPCGREPDGAGPDPP